MSSLRPSDIGLTADRIDFLRRVVHVDRQLVTVSGRAPFPGLVLITDAGNPIRRTAFGDIWRTVVKAADAPTGTGFHELRHYYASLLIRHSESVKVVQARLGHASASETLDTYSHLWPDSDVAPVRRSILSFFADSVRTGEVVDGRNP
jgi:integrase